jgi:hypothetical protein
MASIQKQIFAVMKSLTGQENILTIPRSLIEYTGSKDSALFLSQLIYWSDKGHDPEGWIYKTIPQWKDELDLSRYAVDKARKLLIKKDVLECKVKKIPGSTNTSFYYRLDIEKFVKSYIEFIEKRSENRMDTGSVENSSPDLGVSKTTTPWECRNSQPLGSVEIVSPSYTEITYPEIISEISILDEIDFSKIMKEVQGSTLVDLNYAMGKLASRPKEVTHPSSWFKTVLQNEVNDRLSGKIRSNKIHGPEEKSKTNKYDKFYL